MKIRIYQIDLKKDKSRKAFLSLSKSDPLDSRIYKKVFEGAVNASDLEEVYMLFNLNPPSGYTGRSLSVSDVVEIVSEDSSRFFYCDSIGFSELMGTFEVAADES